MFNRNRDPWLSLYKYKRKYKNENIMYDIPEYREEGTCRWCGKKLPDKRKKSYCSTDCRDEFERFAVWGRGCASLPYRILCRDNFTCLLCGKPIAYVNEHGMRIPKGVNANVHHIDPVVEGGTDNQYNLATLCSDECHKDHKKLLIKSIRDKLKERVKERIECSISKKEPKKQINSVKKKKKKIRIASK